MTVGPIGNYFENAELFAPSWFERVLVNPALPAGYAIPQDAAQRLEALRTLWRRQRTTFIRDTRASGKAAPRTYVGLPPFFAPMSGTSESDIENGFIRPVCEAVLGYSAVQNRPLVLRESAVDTGTATQRPDLVLFADRSAFEGVLDRFGSDASRSAPADGPGFCQSAALILDAKRFDKGVGADESPVPAPKSRRVEPTAIEDVQQVGRYLRGCDVRWGVLTNGRSWRLMRQGRMHDHVRFDLVRFLEDLGDASIDDFALGVFGFFWHIFGPPGAAGGYLDALERESEASNRRVREVLRNQAHSAVETIARGFWSCVDNARDSPVALTVAPTLPEQAELDHLREVSLTLLYRLLFILKAEAQDLLRLRDGSGASSLYARERSSAAIFSRIDGTSAGDRARVSTGYELLKGLFSDIDRGSPRFEIPAYNGGLFNDDKHPELAHWLLLDDALHEVLNKLIYIEGDVANPVPYADLDVRDLGDIYEGLLEQRLTGVASDPPSLHLRNEKGERKASGSYFTRDELVDHLVRRALQPLLAEAEDDPERILDIRVLDPAMGSGHFLVKVVDVLADHLTVHCDPVDPDAPRDNGPAERAYWKRAVVEQCVYGVDFNPMAVELARVALWLHTAEYGRPLSFLDHHLKVGNSLVGASLDRLASPGLKSKLVRDQRKWVPVDPPEPEAIVSDGPPKGSARRKKNAVPSTQLALPFTIDTGLLSGIIASIHALLERPSHSAEEVKRKSQAYADRVEGQLAAHHLLADLWCLQWFMGEPTDELIEAYESPTGLYAQVKEACGIVVDERREQRLAELLEHPLARRAIAARTEGYGPRMESFFHWELAFPEVAFDSAGKRRSGFGFDAVVGNPPWDRIRAERRQFYGPWGQPDRGPEWDVANTQASSLDALIARLHGEHPTLAEGWTEYERDIENLNQFLRDGGAYEHQVVELDGRKTGGDPDTFRYFVERAFHAVRTGGRVALVVPSTLWQAQGCTGLRRLLLLECTTEELFVFENYRKWAFDIHSSFKFTTFVVSRSAPAKAHGFDAAFMLRDLRVLYGLLPERVVRMTARLAEELSPGTLAMLDLASRADGALVDRLHSVHSTLGADDSGWKVSYRCELHMTNDAWRFKAREWMLERGFAEVVSPGETADESPKITGGSPTATYPADLPSGGPYFVAADPGWYEQRDYLARTENFGDRERTIFVRRDDAGKKPTRGVDASVRHAILPGEQYTALYVGRSIHQFNPAAAVYESGEGHRQVWSSLSADAAKSSSNYFVAASALGRPVPARVGFRDIARGTDERSLIATVLAPGRIAGNTVPTLISRDGTWPEVRMASLVAVLNSFVADWLLRPRINTHVNWTYLSSIPIPQPESLESNGVGEVVARLVSVIPELDGFWSGVMGETWTHNSPARTDTERAALRAELDARVADAYGLSVPEYARVLTAFPLLDRDQPPLEGDRFVTDATDDVPRGVEGVDWEETGFGVYELKPRSFITRDLALLTYMRLKGVAPPQDLHAFYRDEVGLDPDGPLSRFRVGSVLDLIDRVELAREAGAVAYVPSR